MTSARMTILFRSGLRCRLCRRIAAYVLATVIVVEAAILLPSVRNYERDLLHRLEDVGRLQAISAYRAAGYQDGHDFLLRGGLILTPCGLAGAALYGADGRRIGTFGEPPAVTRPGEAKRSPNGQRYDVAWPPSATGLPFTVVGRLDASCVPVEVRAFVWRILGLILLISVVVWTATMLIVGITVFRPMLALQASLARARADPSQADRYAVPAAADSSLGDMIRDINALYARVARTYREELSAFTAMAERAGNAIIAFDALGRATYANPACLALCGSNCVEELARVGIPTVDFASGGADMTIPESLAGGSYSREATVIGRGGRRVPCIVNASLIAGDDVSPFHFYANLQDISDLRAAQCRMAEQNRALAVANRAKSDFLACMSHELRTPLNAVIGFAEIMAAELKGPLGAPVYREYADDILTSGRHLLELVNDVLDLARIDADAMPLNESPVDVRTIVRSIGRAAEAIAAERDVLIACTVPPDVPSVLADERRLRQILLNLVGNAIKFSRPGGLVAVEAGVVDGALALTVRDHGIGMAEADIPHALEPFSQLEGPLSRHHDGAGLGLALARALTELHGGDLGIESRLGVGTTVTVALPAHRTMTAASLA